MPTKKTNYFNGVGQLNVKTRGVLRNRSRKWLKSFIGEISTL